jgi:hypothetical protein
MVKKTYCIYSLLKRIFNKWVKLSFCLLLYFNFGSNLTQAQVDQESTRFCFGGLHVVNVNKYTTDTPLPSIHLGYARRIPLKKNPTPKTYYILQAYIQYNNFMDSNFYKYSSQKDYAIYSIVGINADASFPLGFFDYKDRLKTFIIYGTSITPFFWARNSINNSISYDILKIRLVNFYFGFASDIKVSDSFYINLSNDNYLFNYFPKLIEREKSSLRKLFGRSLIAFKITGQIKW